MSPKMRYPSKGSTLPRMGLAKPQMASLAGGRKTWAGEIVALLGGVFGLVKNEAVTVEIPREKLVGRAPEI